MGLGFSHPVPSCPIFFRPGGGFKAEFMPFGRVPGRNFDSGAIVSHFVPFLTLRPGRVCRGGHHVGVRAWGFKGSRNNGNEASPDLARA